MLIRKVFLDHGGNLADASFLELLHISASLLNERHGPRLKEHGHMTADVAVPIQVVLALLGNRIMKPLAVLGYAR